MNLLLLSSFPRHALPRTALVLGALAFTACSSRVSDEAGSSADDGATDATAQSLTLASMRSAATALAAGAPDFKSLTDTSAGMSLTWQGPGGSATGFTIYRMLKSEGAFRHYASLAADQGPSGLYTWLDAQVTLGAEYCYAVGAPGAQSSVPMSITRCLAYTAGGAVAVPGTPGLALQEALSDRIRLLVTDNATNETSTVVERRPLVAGTLPPWQTIATLPAQNATGTATTVEDTGLDIDASYQYRARSVNDAGQGITNTLTLKTSPWTLAVADADGPVITHISRPASALGSALAVEWNTNSASARGWTVSVSQGLSGDATSTPLYFSDTPLLATRSFTADSLTPGTPYCFTVKNNDTNRTSNRLCDIPYAVRHSADDHGPQAMTSMTSHPAAGASNTAATINFDDPNPAPVANLFEYWKDADGIRNTRLFQNNAQPGTGKAVTFDSPRFDPGTHYCFRVLSANTFGSKSSAVTCTSTTAIPPSAPGTLTAAKTTGSYNFTLKLSGTFTNVDSFVVKLHGTRGSDTDDGERDFGLQDFVASGNALKLNLSDTYRYCFTVQTVNSVGTSAPSNTACAGTELPPPPPPPPPSTVTIQMAEQPFGAAGYLPYAGSFGPIFAGATITNINFPVQFPAVFLVKPGHTTQDCGDPSAVVLVHGDMTSDQLQAIFGSSTLHISGQQKLFFAGCTTASVVNPPPWLPVNISWTEP